MPLKIIVRGGGDLASGVALRLFRLGLKVIITELPQPLFVRRAVSFGEAVYRSQTQVEDVTAMLARDLDHCEEIFRQGQLPVLIDPSFNIAAQLKDRSDAPFVLIDARMTKQPPGLGMDVAALVIGLGPGFEAGRNCHAVIETNRGHWMGRVIWNGSAERDTGAPEKVNAIGAGRVLRSPVDGELVAFAEIGDSIAAGQVIAEVGGVAVKAPFQGVLRGLLHPGLTVWKGLKIGDLDPRADPIFCFTVSDKSLAVAGGVMEVLFSNRALRPFLWD